MDGDKIATLCADFLSEQVRKSGLPGDWSSAIVQTAYANGASTGTPQPHHTLHRPFETLSSE